MIKTVKVILDQAALDPGIPEEAKSQVKGLEIVVLTVEPSTVFDPLNCGDMNIKEAVERLADDFYTITVRAFADFVREQKGKCELFEYLKSLRFERMYIRKSQCRVV